MAAKTTKTNDGTTTTNAKPRKLKGPELSWNSARRAVLIGLIAAGHTNTTDIAAQLAADPAFEGVSPAAFTAGKVRLQLANLRKAGVAVPQTGRGREEIDVAGLNALLGVASEQPAA